MTAPTLEGRLVRLEPLTLDHAVDLGDAGDEDRSAYLFNAIPTRSTIESYIADALRRSAEGTLVPMAQIRTGDDRAVGCTAFGTLRPWPDRPGLYAVEIGWTWLAASAQRTGINRESKLLLMTFAFESLGVARVDLKTDARNDRSKKAIAGIGATFEGVLRSWSESHRPGEDGLLRDSAMFSVIAADWPQVKVDLRNRLKL